METKDTITLAVTILLALAGWLTLHGLTARREMEQKKREFRVTHLRKAYNDLARVCDRGGFETHIGEIQDAFNDIQLFGEESQIGLIGRIIEQANADGPLQLDDLLKELRNEIRGHIGLRPLDSYRWSIRLEPAGEEPE